jgi:membrane protease YdiL (CAAX protease family)
VIDDRIAGWLVALVLMGTLVVAARPGRRSSACAAAALLVLYVIALVLAQERLGGAWPPAIAAAAVWLVMQPLIGAGRITRAELGLVPLRSGSAWPALLVTALALALNAALIVWRDAAAPVVAPGTALTVTIAAVVEELVMRGAVLAFADRALPPRWSIAGAPIGIGGLLVTLGFVALHGLRPGLLLGVVPAAFLYLWLRARTGSLAAPIGAHVVWNLSVVLLHG